MKKMSIEKQERLKRLTDEAGIISALAIDQRGALKKMINQYKEATSEDIIQFKQMVSQYLTPMPQLFYLIQNTACLQQRFERKNVAYC